MLHRKKKVDSPMSEVELADLKHGDPVWEKKNGEQTLLYKDKQAQEFVPHDEFVARQKKYAEGRKATYLRGHRNGWGRRQSFFFHT